MENKSSTENKVVCRKCGGPHFTIKCGKEKKTEPVETPTPVNEQKNANTETPVETTKPDDSTKSYDKKPRAKPYGANGTNGDSEFKPKSERKYFKTTYRVKLSELPTDMSEEELMEMTTDWGHIVKIKLLVYEESSTAYIDFGYEDEADYFVEAIDKTPFEYRMLTSCRVESFRAEKPQDQ